MYLRAATAVFRRTKNIQTPPQLQLWATQLELSDAEIDERSKTLNDQKYGLMNYKDTKSKCLHLRKLTCKGTLRQMFICLRPPPLLDFCLGWSSNFVGSESGQIQSVNLLQNMVSNRTQHSPPPSSHTLSVYILYFDTGKRGREMNHREG